MDAPKISTGLAGGPRSQLVWVLAVGWVALAWAWWGSVGTAELARWAFGVLDPPVVLGIAAALVVAGVGARILGPPAGGTLSVGGPVRRALTRLRPPPVPTAVALAAIVGLVAVFRVALGRAYHLPTVLGDELIYTGLAKGWALHGMPILRGNVEVGYSTLYPLFLAPAFRLAADGAAALEAVRVLNAVAMAAAAVPAFLLARRAVPRGWALGVALLSVAVPWTAYSALTLTESLFYPAFVAYAALLASTLERPTPVRQAALLAALALLVGIRTQALAVALGTVGAVVVYGVAGGSGRATLRRFLPTLAVLAAFPVAGLVASTAGIALPTSTYNALFESLGSVGGMLKWGAWSLGVFAFALGVVAVAAFPVAVVAMLRGAEPPGGRAVAATAVALGAAVLASVALLSASPYGLDRLHERSLFFATPLVLACLAHWLWRGLPRPRLLSLGCALAVLALAAALPRDLVFDSFHVDVPSALFFRELEGDLPGVPFRAWAISIAAVGAGTFLVARRPVFPLLTVVLAFAAVTARVDYRDSFTDAQARALAWVDRSLPRGAEATLVNLGVPYSLEPCASPAWHEQQRLVVWTEYLNARVGRVAWLYEPNHFDAVPSNEVTLGEGGLTLLRGSPFAPEYVVIDSRQPVRGDPVARFELASIEDPLLQNGASLTLWRIDPPLRLEPRATPLPPRGDGRGC